MLKGGYFEYKGTHPMLDYGMVYLLTMDYDGEDLEVSVHTGLSSRMRKTYKTERDFARDWKYREDYVE